MKRFVVSLLALLLLSGVSVAQRLSVSDVEVVPGTTASFALTVDVEEGVYSGFQFEMQFPATGFSTTGNATAASTWQGGTLFVGDLNAGVGRVAALSTTDKPIPDGEMVIGTVEFAVGENVALGEYDVTISAFNFLDGTNYAPVADVTFKVKVVDALNVYLDENATVAPEAAQGVNVHVRRTINADSWSTIVLPFSMTAAQVKSAFGDDVELADFVGCDTQLDNEDNVTGINVKFVDATSIEANHPYIIKVSEAVTEFTVEGVDIVPEEEPSVDCDRIGKGTSRDPFRYNSFIGTYVANTAVPEEDLFISENKFWYSTGLTMMKAFRGYFEFYDVLSEMESAGARITLSFGGEVTAVAYAPTESEPTEKVFDLQGRRVRAMGRGLYIRNGRIINKQ